MTQTLSRLKTLKEVTLAYLVSRSSVIGIVGILLLFVFVASIVNAQETLDTPVEVAIEEQVVDTSTQVTPTEEVGVPVIDERDFTRLDVKAFQTLANEDTGEYIQVGLGKELIEGDSVTFNAVAVYDLKGNEEIHVYEAPCGRGWQLIVYEYETLVEGFQFDTYGNEVPAYKPLVRSYGYGCESVERTFNW